MSQIQWLPAWPQIALHSEAHAALHQQFGTELDSKWSTPDQIDQIGDHLAAAGLAVLVIDARAPEVPDAQFQRRLAECAKAAELLGVPTLSDIDLHQLPSALSALHPHDQRGLLRRRTRHVVTERARSAAFADLLQHGLGTEGKPDLDSAWVAGQLMDASHSSLRDDFEATAPQTDLAVATVQGAGAFGARVLGAGFGDIVVALVAIPEIESIAGAVTHGFATVGFEPPAFLVAHSG